MSWKSERWILTAAALALVAGTDGTNVESIRVGLVGDSITAGNVAPDRDGGQPYAELLETRLSDAYTLTNYGVGGSTTADWAPDGPLFARVQREDIVLVQLGSNDALYGNLHPSAYHSAMQTLVEALLERGVEHVIVVAPPRHPGSSDPANRLNRRLAEYAVMLEKLCRTPKVHCGPNLFDALAPLDAFFVDPGRGGESDPHPNANGHRRIAELVTWSIQALASE